MAHRLDERAGVFTGRRQRQAKFSQTGTHLSSLDIRLSICLGILNRLLRLCMRLRLRLGGAPAIVVRIPGKHGVKAEAACSATHAHLSKQRTHPFCQACLTVASMAH